MVTTMLKCITGMPRTGYLLMMLPLVIIGVSDKGNAQQGVTISFKMLEPTVTLHEPVRVDFSIHNGLPEQIEFDLGFNRKGNFDFIVTEAGNIKKHLPRLSEEGPGRIGRLSLDTGQTYSQILLLNEWYHFIRPGEYEIEARFLGALRTQSGSVMKLDHTNQMHLQILPANPAQLKTVCQALAKVAIGASTFVQASEAALALSFMEDPEVVPCLEEVLQKGKLVRAQAAVGLGRIANREAIEILISHLSSGDPELVSLVRYVLKEIVGKTDNQETKDRINSVLKR